MVNSIIILCEDSPFGKNSAVESIRMAAGILAIGDIDDCKIIFMKDAVYFFSQNLNPDAIHVDHFTNIMRLIELSEIEIYVHDEALEEAGMDTSDLIPSDTIHVVNIEKISELIINADMSFKY